MKNGLDSVYDMGVAIRPVNKHFVPLRSSGHRQNLQCSGVRKTEGSGWGSFSRRDTLAFLSAAPLLTGGRQEAFGSPAGKLPSFCRVKSGNIGRKLNKFSSHC